MQIDSQERVKIVSLKKSTKVINTVEAYISSYEGKNKQGEKIFSTWKCYFKGEAYYKALELQQKDIILLRKAKVVNDYNYEKNKIYVNVVCYNFEIAGAEFGY